MDRIDNLIANGNLKDQQIAAIYIRVSTDAQESKGTSPQSQLEDCSQCAREQGYTVPANLIFMEQALGADPERPKLLELLRLVESKKVHAVIIYDVSRLARDTLMQLIFAVKCRENGVELVFVKSPSGTDTDSNFMRTMEGFFSEKEREKTLERTERGKMVIAKSGRLPHGCGKGLYGYNYDPNKKVRTINETEAEVIKEIYESYLGGGTFFGIAERLNQEGKLTQNGSFWYTGAIKRILTNESYIGVDNYKQMKSYALPGGKRKAVMRPKEDWIYIGNFSPRIIDSDLFDKVQTRIRSRTRVKAKGRKPYILTGFLYCGICGRRANGTTMDHKYRYYQCRYVRKSPSGPATCNAKYVRADELEVAVWEKLTLLLTMPEVVMLGMQREIDVLPKVNSQIQELEEEIANLYMQEQNLVELIGIRGVDANLVSSRLVPVTSERESLEERLSTLRDLQSNRRLYAAAQETVTNYCEVISRNLGKLDVEGKRQTFSAFDLRIVIIKGRFDLEITVDPSS